jgi:hypothetical protein
MVKLALTVEAVTGLVAQTVLVLSPVELKPTICPHPVVAKVIKAAQIARAWNLKRDFATPFRP